MANQKRKTLQAANGTQVDWSRIRREFPRLITKRDEEKTNAIQYCFWGAILNFPDQLWSSLEASSACKLLASMRSSKSFGFNICVADSNFLDKLNEYSSEHVWVSSIKKDSNN